MVNLMLVLNHSLLNRKCNLINALKALITTVSKCSLRVIPGFYLNHDVSETGFCFRLQMEPTQLDPIDRAITRGRVVNRLRQKTET
jgi:hypothetical protein